MAQKTNWAYLKLKLKLKQTMTKETLKTTIAFLQELLDNWDKNIGQIMDELHTDLPKVFLCHVNDSEIISPLVLKAKFEYIISLLKLYPETVLGGSYGLALSGYKFDRDLTYSDFDLMTTHKDFKIAGETNTYEGSPGSDFDLNYKINLPNVFFKVDVKIIDNLPTYENKIGLKVQDPKVTLSYKKQYAERGNVKHQSDLKFFGIEFNKPKDVLENIDFPF